MSWYEPADQTPREQCPCCDYVTLPERGMSLICPICYWEEDTFVGHDLDELSCCNHMNLRQAKANFAAFGACNCEMLKHVVAVADRIRFARLPLPLDEFDRENQKWLIRRSGEVG